LYISLVASSQKTTSFASFGHKKIENAFLCGKSKNPSYKSCRPWKDAHLCQKWDQDSKVFYETCKNHGQLGKKPSELLLGAIFCEEFFSEILLYNV
jgi:hypothetical protein